MELYHASRKEMDVGDYIVSSYTSDFYPEASEEMDSERPCGKPSRAEALYCSDIDEFAVFYLMLQEVPKDKIKLYKVEVNDFHKAPFSITNVINRRIETDQPRDLLIKEYWNPRKNWTYYEFLTLEFTIIEKLEIPFVDEIAIRSRYGRDSDQAQQIS